MRGIIRYGLALIVALHCVHHADAQGASSRLLRTLTGRSEAVRLKAIRQLHQQPSAARHESVSDLAEALQWHIDPENQRGDLVPQSTIALVDLIVSIDHPDVDEIIDATLQCERYEIVMATTDALGRHRRSEWVEKIERLAERSDFDERFAYRSCIVKSLNQMQHPDAFEAMARLEQQTDGLLAHQLKAMLDEVTLDHFGGDQERYKKFVKRDVFGAERKSEIFKSANFQREPGPSLSQIAIGKPHNYYGIDIHAKRVLFVIDHSGSMREYAEGGTRLMRAKRELVQAINGLPEDSRFSIVFFEQAVRCWRENLVHASDKNKAEAKQFIQRLQYGKKTNTHSALLKAMDFDDDLESVFLLTDGKPTAGKLVSPALIVQDVLRRNQWRHLVINTIGISVEGQTEDFLKSIAQGTGGEFRLPE